MFLFLIVSKANALVITATGLPKDYRVYEWNTVNIDDRQGEATYSGLRASAYETFNFNIPDRFVMYDTDGKIELYKSLERWRGGTGRTGYTPRTDPDSGVARFPFYQDYDPDNPQVLPDAGKFIGLTSALMDQKKYPEMSFTSSDGRDINTKVPGLIARLDSLLVGNRSVNCLGNSGKSEECLVCNCANESWVEPQEGRININQTVLRRVQLNNYPDEICKVIWQRSQFAWTRGASSDYPGMSQRSISGNMLRQCVAAAKESVSRGPWKYDSFYNPRLAAPKWGWWDGISPRGHQHRYVQNPDFKRIPLNTRQSTLNNAIFGASGVN